MKKNLIFIGMPAVGKSTVGIVVAKRLGMRFIDTDLLIQEQEGKLLREIIAESGVDEFLEIENRVNASVKAQNAVISPGGSVVYCEEAMEHLKSSGTVIYLKLSLNALSKRLGNLKGRGVLLKDGQTLSGLYEERSPLYERYADIVIDEEGKDLEASLKSVLEILEEKDRKL